jgi:hypothetical protein
MERHDMISALMDIITKPTISSVVKMDYQQQLLSITLKLQKIAVLKEHLIDVNNSVQSELETLVTLPSLALFTVQEVDQFSFDEPEKIELIAENIDNFISLTSRYPEKLSNTSAMLKGVNLSRENITNQLVALTENVEHYASIVDSQKQKMTNQVKFISSAT